jgi:hypothetical protein
MTCFGPFLDCGVGVQYLVCTRHNRANDEVGREISAKRGGELTLYGDTYYIMQLEGERVACGEGAHVAAL